MARKTAHRFAEVVTVIMLVLGVGHLKSARAIDWNWNSAHATFYGGSNAQGTQGGACGYGNLYNTGYGIQTAALSGTLFRNGAACGACFEIKCASTSSRWCKPGAGSIKITATNLCPQNLAHPSNNGGWCNNPREHFDMAQPAYEEIAIYKGGIVPVYYRRVSCRRNGGIRFTMYGNAWAIMILVTNVAGAGNPILVSIKTPTTNWMNLRRNWGSNWELKDKAFVEAKLSIRLTTEDGRSVTSWDVIPSNWRFQQTYQGQNFW